MISLAVYSFPHGWAHAEALALALGVPLAAVNVHVFPDEESLVTVPEAAETAVFYCPLDRPNTKLVELMLACDALRRSGTRRLVLVAPYLCYMRQDKTFQEGEAVSQQAIARFLSTLFDRILTIDAHLHRMDDIAQVFPGMEAQNLIAAPLIAEFAQSKGLGADILVAGPDAESIQWVDKIADVLSADVIAGSKLRRSDHEVEIIFPKASVQGRVVLLADDIVSSGGTMVVAIESLVRAGASKIFVAVTHALFDDAVEARLKIAGACEIWSTTAVPHSTNAILLTTLLVDALGNEMRK